MTQSAAAKYFCNRNNLRAAAIAICLATTATLPGRLLGAEPDFDRAEIWVGGQLVQAATAPVDRDQRAVVYIDGQRIDPLARRLPTPAPKPVPPSEQSAPLSGRPAMPVVEQAPIESSGPLVIEFPTPGRYPAPAPATAPAPAAVPVPDEATVAPATPSVAVRESTRDVQPAVLNVPQGASRPSVELTAGFSAAHEREPQAIAVPAVATPPQAPKLLPDVQQPTSWPVQPAPLFADAPSLRPHVGRTNLSPSIFFWPLVIGLLLVFYVQRMAAKKRSA